MTSDGIAHGTHPSRETPQSGSACDGQCLNGKVADALVQHVPAPVHSLERSVARAVWMRARGARWPMPTHCSTVRHRHAPLAATVRTGTRAAASPSAGEAQLELPAPTEGREIVTLSQHELTLAPASAGAAAHAAAARGASPRRNYARCRPQPRQVAVW